MFFWPPIKVMMTNEETGSKTIDTELSREVESRHQKRLEMTCLK